MLALFVLNIIFNNFWVLFIFCSVWIPQILQNARMNQRNIPSMPYALAQTANIAVFPLYLNVIDGNFLFLRPNYLFGFVMIFWISLQILCLFIQQKRPRFMLTRTMRESLQDDYYRYEQTFIDDAALSSDSFLTDREQLRSRGGFEVMNDDERQNVAMRRLVKIQDFECSICNNPL